MRTVFWLSAALAAAGSAYAAFTGLSLRIGNEIQPPGGMLQMKVFLTEPKPISTGKGKIAISATFAADVEGVSLFSTNGDAAGAAVIHGSRVQMVCIVPSTVLGSNPDLPLLTITSKVRNNAALGSSTPLSISPANLVFLDQNGVPYPEEISAGSLTIASNVSITDVNPGSISVPAGGTVVVSGLNFTPTTTVQFKEVNLSSVTYVSPTELDVTVGAPVTMQGQQVTVNNPDGTSAVYYAFQRTTLSGRSASGLLNATLPLFAGMFWTSATFSLPADSGTTFSGLAVQNLQPVSATVRVSLIAANGTTVGKRTLSLAANSRFVRQMVELVSTPPPAGSHWLVHSSTPVQMLGLSADSSTAVVSPVLATSAH